MYYTIYKIVNKLNDKSYIGKHQTKNLNDGYMGSGKLIKAAIKKYGIENFEKQILYIFDNEAEMNAKEKELVVVSEDSYNLCEGGKGGFSYINAHENKKNWVSNGGKNSSCKDYYQDEQNRNKMLIKLENARRCRNNFDNFRGKKHSDETKIKISLKAKQRRSNSQTGTCWISNNIETIKIKKEEINSYLLRGYVKGRKILTPL